MERILLDGFIPHVWMSGDTVRHTAVAPDAAVLQ